MIKAINQEWVPTRKYNDFYRKKSGAYRKAAAFRAWLFEKVRRASGKVTLDLKVALVD
jgi:hypothetical protein